MTEEKPIFTKINNPLVFRKIELEALRELIHILKNFERIRATRTEKAEKTILLKKQCNEINTLMNSLKDKLPSYAEIKKKHNGAKGKMPGMKPKQGKLKQKKVHSLAELETQLDEVQKRLEVIS